MSAEQFFRLGASLHMAARGGLRRRLVPSLKATAERRKPYVNARLAVALPNALKPKALRVKQNVAVRGLTGIRVTVPGGPAGAGLSRSNALLVDSAGIFRHPVFADPRETRAQWDWVSQGAPRGVQWFEKGWQNQAPEFRRGLARAIDDVLEDIVRKAR